MQPVNKVEKLGYFLVDPVPEIISKCSSRVIISNGDWGGVFSITCGVYETIDSDDRWKKICVLFQCRSCEVISRINFSERKIILYAYVTEITNFALGPKDDNDQNPAILLDGYIVFGSICQDRKKAYLIAMSVPRLFECQFNVTRRSNAIPHLSEKINYLSQEKTDLEHWLPQVDSAVIVARKLKLTELSIFENERQNTENRINNLKKEIDEEQERIGKANVEKIMGPLLSKVNDKLH